jgi:hypothetical protein
MSIGQVVVFIHELGPTSVKWYYGQLTDKKIFKGAPLKIYSSELKQIQTPVEWVSYLGTTPPTMLEIENPRGFFSTPVGINSWSLITPSDYVIPVLRMLDSNPAYKFLVTDLTEMPYTTPLAAQPPTTGRRPYAEVKFENKLPVATAKPKKGMSVRWANNNNANSVGAVGKEGEEDAETALARRMLERAVIGSKKTSKAVRRVDDDLSSVRAVGKYDDDDDDDDDSVAAVAVDPRMISKYVAPPPAPSVASHWRAAAEVAAVSEKPKAATVTKAKMIPSANELATRAAAEEADRLKKEAALAKRRATIEAKKIAQATAAEKRKATLSAKRLEEEERTRKDREGFLAFTAAKLAKGKPGTDSVFSVAGV